MRDRGEILDASVYNRWNKILKENDLVVHFNNEEFMGGCIFINENRKGIGLSGDPIEFSYFNITSSVLIQRGEAGYTYVSMKDTVVGFGLDYLLFSESRIEFSSFADYKKYGKRIIIEKK